MQLVPANLGTVCIESHLYGVFFLLAVTSIYFLVRREKHNMRRKQFTTGICKSLFKQPMFAAAIALLITITAQWILTVTRLFQAFVLYKGGNAPLEFYGDLRETTEVFKTGFLIATLVFGDSMLIYRLWIVWGHNTWVIIFPCCTLVSLMICSVGITYQFTQHIPGEDVSDIAAGRWITSDAVFTLCTNIYCSAMIAFRIWRLNHAVRHYGGASLTVHLDLQ